MPKCSDPGCAEFRFDIDAALREGWDTIDDEPYCPLHHSGASWRARKAELEEELRAQLRVLRAKRMAKRELSDGDYRAWDAFQSDLADYHKEHGRPAHPALRTLDHRQWLQTYRATGPIDVEEAVRHTEAAEAAHKSDRERLARGL
jgi:hypothetical protein